MDLQLRGKSALVTGGSRGIGYAIANALLNEGTHVIITSRASATLEAARAHHRTHTATHRTDRTNPTDHH